MKNLFSTLTLSLICAISAIAQPTVVSGVQFVPTDIPFNDDGFIVPDGAELYFENGTYDFNTGRGIEVMTGGYLQLDGPDITLTSSSGYWAGITSYAADVAYNTANSQEDNWGLVVKHNFIIQRAKTGIFMRKEMADYNTVTETVDVTTDGYARSILTYNGTNTCQFINNQLYDIRIHNGNIAQNHSSSGGTSPVWSNYYMTSNSADFEISVEIRNTNMMVPWENFKIETPMHGIYLGNSNARISDSHVIASALNSHGIVHKISTNNTIPSAVENSTIRAYTYGIYTRKSLAMYIANNTISAKHYDIYAHETIKLIASHNTLNFAKYGVHLLEGLTSRIELNTCVDNPGISIFAMDCNDTRIAENNVGWNTNPVISDEGIHVEDCNNTRVIRNRYRRANEQLHIYGTNPNIRIACNSFEDPGTGLVINAAIMIIGTPINNQGDGFAGANNFFNLLPAGIMRVNNTTGTPLTFTNTIAIPNNLPSFNTNFLVNGLLPFNCNIPKIAFETEVEEDDFTPTPNPFTSHLNIGEDVASVQIYSISGQMIGNIKTTDTQVNLEHLNSGTYFVVLNQTNGNTTRHKVIKQ